MACGFLTWLPSISSWNWRPSFFSYSLYFSPSLFQPLYFIQEGLTLPEFRFFFSITLPPHPTPPRIHFACRHPHPFKYNSKWQSAKKYNQGENADFYCLSFLEQDFFFFNLAFSVVFFNPKYSSRSLLSIRSQHKHHLLGEASTSNAISSYSIFFLPDVLISCVTFTKLYQHIFLIYSTSLLFSIFPTTSSFPRETKFHLSFLPYPPMYSSLIQANSKHSINIYWMN